MGQTRKRVIFLTLMLNTNANFQKGNKIENLELNLANRSKNFELRNFGLDELTSSPDFHQMFF